MTKKTALRGCLFCMDNLVLSVKFRCKMIR
ncbi:unknown [Firmicutes bacterium CAG:194]|nr:unknown [Firmicutes bacterium CAG:194]